MSAKLCDCKVSLPPDIFLECQKPIQYTKMIDVFNWIKQKAMCDEGLTVECKGDKLIFIKGHK